MGILEDYMRQQAEARSQAQQQAKRDALLAMGMSLLGTRKGQELEGLGRAGLLGLATARNTNIPEGPSLRDMLALQQYEQQQKEREAAQAEQQAMRGAATASIVGGSPEMGPPTPAGGMQPATPGKFDPQQYAQRLYQMGRVNEAMAVEKQYAPKSQFGEFKPSDYTVASVAEAQRTGDISKLVPATPTPKENWVDVPAPPGMRGQQWQRDTISGQMRAIGSPPPAGTTVNVAGALVPPPKDYMWNDKRTAVVPIPGSPAAREVAMEADRGKAALDDAIASTQRVRQGINEVRTMISPMTSGMGSLLTYKPGSQARDLQSKLTNIKSVVALQSLQALKEASKQGASGFGALSEKELTVIESKIANIDQATSGPALKAAVDAVDQEFERLEKRAIRARAAAVIGGK